MASEHDRQEALDVLADAAFYAATELAMEAIRQGKTRGQFVRQYSTDDDQVEMLQMLSDAYSRGMVAIRADA